MFTDSSSFMSASIGGARLISSGCLCLCACVHTTPSNSKGIKKDHFHVALLLFQHRLSDDENAETATGASLCITTLPESSLNVDYIPPAQFVSSNCVSSHCCQLNPSAAASRGCLLTPASEFSAAALTMAAHRYVTKLSKLPRLAAPIARRISRLAIKREEKMSRVAAAENFIKCRHAVWSV